MSLTNAVVSVSPAVPDTTGVCGVTQDGSPQEVSFTAPIISDPSACSSDPALIWKPWVEPLTSDYDASVLQVSVSMEDLKIKVIGFANSAVPSPPIVTDFKIHFTLPDGTDTFFNF